MLEPNANMKIKSKFLILKDNPIQLAHTFVAMKNLIFFLVLILCACKNGANQHPSSIVVYTKEGCPRCAETKEILQERHTVYTEKSISEIENRNEMWDLLHKESGGEPVRLVMPVIVADSTLFYNIQDLTNFCYGL